jgi:hypothetical protein
MRKITNSGIIDRDTLTTNLKFVLLHTRMLLAAYNLDPEEEELHGELDGDAHSEFNKSARGARRRPSGNVTGVLQH